MQSDALPDDSDTLKAMLLAERVQNERLRQIIRDLQRHQFGRRAETLPEDQMLLGLEDVEQAAASDAAGAEQAAPAARDRPELRSVEPIAARYRRICRGLKPPSTSTTRPAVAAKGSCIGSVKTGASGWISCRRSSGCWSRSGRNTLAAHVRMASCSPRHRRG